MGAMLISGWHDSRGTAYPRGWLPGACWKSRLAAHLLPAIPVDDAGLKIETPMSQVIHDHSTWVLWVHRGFWKQL